MAESGVTILARSWPAPSPEVTRGHNPHNVLLTILTSYSLSGARELKVKLPANMTPSCLVTTCHSTHNVLTMGHLRELLVLVSAAWMMLVVHPVLTGLTGLYRILSMMS